MKRFAMTISLAACLVFLCGSIATAADRVTVESKTVLPNAVGVTAGVFIENDLAATGIVIPLEFREQTAGSYITTSFARAYNTAGRLHNSPLGAANPVGPAASITQNRYPAPGGADCAGDASKTYQTPAANVDFVSPDGTLLAAVSQGDENVGDDIDLDPGSDGATASYVFTFNVTGVQGTFIIDTCCVRPANHLSYVDRNTNLVPMQFVPGIITIFQPPNQCPDVNPAGPINATVGAQSCVTLSANDLEGDAPITFHILSGPGTIVGNQLCVTPTCADVAGIDVVVYADDPVASGCDAGATETIHFNVSPAQLQIGCGNVSVHWAGADAGQQINASGGCPPYVYSRQSGLGAVDGSGAWSFDQGCGVVGSSQVTVRVTDANNSFVECTFTLNVTNTEPVCSVIPRLWLRKVSRLLSAWAVSLRVMAMR
jgi:hypothetical protein